jgi:hypothetical protein
MRLLHSRIKKVCSRVSNYFQGQTKNLIPRDNPILVNSKSELVQQPILVYQMGKVGSSSIFAAVAALGVSVFHIHTLNPKSLAERTERSRAQGHIPMHIRHSHRVRENFLEKNRPLRIITAVRDPIARNISAYFQNLHFLREQKSAFDEDELNAIMSEFMSNYSHSVPLTWFDQEIRDVIGVDVYEHPFPKNEGVQRIHEKDKDILILKAETSDEVKINAIKEFLRISELSLEPKNIGEEKPYKHYYKAFLNRIQLPEAYLKEMYESRYAQHFYTPEEINKFRERWMRG